MKRFTFFISWAIMQLNSLDPENQERTFMGVNRKSSVPTMKDVAELAGVSLGTVSNVVRGLPVGEEYREKVDQSAIIEVTNILWNDRIPFWINVPECDMRCLVLW